MTTDLCEFCEEPAHSCQCPDAYDGLEECGVVSVVEVPAKRSAWTTALACVAMILGVVGAAWVLRFAL